MRRYDNVGIGVLYTLGIALGIFLAGLAAEWIRSKLAALCRIPALSKKIVVWIDNLLTKSFLFLR